MQRLAEFIHHLERDAWVQQRFIIHAKALECAQFARGELHVNRSDIFGQFRLGDSVGVHHQAIAWRDGREWIAIELLLHVAPAEDGIRTLTPPHEIVDARDAAHGLTLAMEKGRIGERYLLGSATAMPRASGFLWNRNMMVHVNCRGYVKALGKAKGPASDSASGIGRVRFDRYAMLTIPTAS